MRRQLFAAMMALGLAAGMAKGASLSAPTTFYGMCDASAAVTLDTNLFVVANDEDNVLRVYRRTGGLPVLTRDLSAFLRVNPKSPESDIEGAARVGDRIYWMTSHGRNAKGKNSPNRQQFFATTVSVKDGQVRIEPTGRSYTRLLLDFAREPRLAAFRLGAASRLAPKARGGLNIEGLTATPDGQLLIGFRNPIPQGKALLVPLLNPAELIEGKSAKFGDPILLELAGQGVRSMGYAHGRYVIIAGPYDNEGESHLFEWHGPGSAPKRIEGVRFTDANPEGLSWRDEDGREEFFILSDDGTRKIGGMECKRLKDPNQRQFRGYTFVP